MTTSLQDKLESSLLSLEDGEKLKITWADHNELKYAGLSVALAIKIPYFTVEGEAKDFCRYRYMEDNRDSIAKLTNKKPLKYAQPKGSLPEIYLPPFINWVEIASSIDYSVAITEGEFKAACVTKHIMPCIGLGGVNSFKCNKLGIPLLPGFYDFQWAGRKVIIVFDSDTETNINVHKALISFANTLTDIGAVVHIAKIPAEGDGKVGVDDYAKKFGVAEAAKLIAESEQFTTNRILHDLNMKIVFIKEKALIAEVNEDKNFLMNTNNFINANYANIKLIRVSVNDKGAPKITELSAAREWIKWLGRREVNDLVFRPGGDRFINNNLNIWVKWGCEAIAGSIEPWNKLLDHLFEGCPAERLWFERWLAYPLQRPCSKMYAAVVIWGTAHGTGKTLVGETIMKMYGEDAAKKIENEDLDNPRHEWAENTMFVLGDEIASHDRRKSSTKLKSLITQNTIRIDKKFLPSYQIDDYINYYFTSNSPVAFYIENTDRRYFVHQVFNKPLPKEFYKHYIDWLNNGGASYLYHYLLHLDLGGMAPGSLPPVTEGKDNMAFLAKNDAEAFADILNYDPDSLLVIGEEKLKGDLWTAEDLIKIFEAGDYGRNSPKVGPTYFSRILQSQGFIMLNKGKPIRTCLGDKRLFAIRNRDKWDNSTDIEEMIKHFNLYRDKKY